MSNAKKMPPYLLRIENAEQAALLVQLFERAAAPAPQAGVLAAMWANVQGCAKHFAAGNEQKG